MLQDVTALLSSNVHELERHMLQQGGKNQWLQLLQAAYGVASVLVAASKRCEESDPLLGTAATVKKVPRLLSFTSFIHCGLIHVLYVVPKKLLTSRGGNHLLCEKVRLGLFVRLL